MTETIRALLFSAEAQAHEDQHGNFIPLRGPLDTSRNLFPKILSAHDRNSAADWFILLDGDTG